ncbi:MAG: hypothetical protein QOH57_1537 [Mycobacterium sp.]|nr:hypothetical protein [Mycobacterium sp.]
MDGWLPTALEALAVVGVIVAVSRRSRRWTVRWIPILLVIGVIAAVTTRWYVGDLGIASEPAPWRLWLWTGMSAATVTAVVAGWPETGWFRRNATVFAASQCILSIGVITNVWIGYFPTVDTAWSQLTARPLPDETDWAAVQARHTQSGGGALLPVDTGSTASGFSHRTEYVYLPPAWFTSSPPPRLPVVMMIGGEFNTPADWVRAGNAVSALDAYAATHSGHAPVAVFADSTGSFFNDTECVNGPRGRAADHLTKDVIPYVANHFGARASNWGVAGFSAGGTCAVDLAVMHPELFRVFLDIAGDPGPNAGNRRQTIDRLYGGDEQAWLHFDPATSIARRGAYGDLAGQFVVPAATGTNAVDPCKSAPTSTDDDVRAASALCVLGRSKGIDCTVVIQPGRHVWPFAATAFSEALPWLDAQLTERR